MMRVHTGAKLRVLKPTPNDVVTANSVPTNVSISNYKLNCAYAGTVNRKGIGRHHIESPEPGATVHGGFNFVVGTVELQAVM